MKSAFWAVLCLVLSLDAAPVRAGALYVAPAGADTNAGTLQQPFATVRRAADAARAMAGREPVAIYLREGTYYLPETLTLTAEDSGSQAAPVVFQAYEREKPVISGGIRLQLTWEPFRDGIMKARTPAGFTTDQLFVNGPKQIMARYPNFNPNERIFNGYAADAFSRERAARWANPAGGFMHAMHQALWGGFSYEITGKDAGGNLTFKGGWQNNRPAPMHREYRFVENIFEELDAPGEWYLDSKSATLYFYPSPELDLKSAVIEGVRLRHLVEFKGTEQRPVRFVSFRGICFRHAARTFMDNKEPMLRTDWTVYRGGAVLFNGAEDCGLEDCLIDQVGGNAVFVNDYNRRVTIRGCHIAKAGGNGIAFVGDPAAVRNPMTWSDKHPSLKAMDKTPGPRTNNYPADCLVDDCLIHETGQVEKQTAPVEFDMSQDITVRHCSIYDVPRAGINIGDGCWGGHVIEFCDVFDTVKETGDHGSFNSWGRDRFWGMTDVDLNTITVGDNRAVPTLDVVKPIILRNSRWRCDHGWDIDLDDGSSRYELRNNLCLHGGIKNREGFFRVVENNIMVNNSFHPHVWYGNSQDIFRHNIVFGPYRPIGMTVPWGAEVDFNLLHKPGQPAAPATKLQKQSGRDDHSQAADAEFMDASHGDYRVKDNSSALKLGFKNFPMDQFGVQKPELKALARTPAWPGKAAADEPESRRDATVVSWLGAKIKNVTGLDEVSAAGLPGEVGIRLEEVPAGSIAAKAGLRPNDVILQCNGKQTASVPDLTSAWKSAPLGPVRLDLWRDQKPLTQNIEKTPP